MHSTDESRAFIGSYASSMEGRECSGRFEPLMMIWMINDLKPKLFVADLTTKKMYEGKYILYSLFCLRNLVSTFHD